jgi:AcrR family transcriptional regulator
MSATAITAPRRPPTLRAAREKPPQARPIGPKFDRILAAATQIFCEKGYEGASIRDIARRSRVSLAGLYYYVGSKEEMLYRIEKHSFTTLLTRVQQQLSAAGPDPETRLRALVRNHIEYFLQNPEAMKVLAHEAESLRPPFAAEVAEIKRAYYRLARGVVEDLKRARRLKSLNTRLAVLSLFGMMNWIYTWYNPRVDPDAGALADHMAGLFLEGIGAVPNPEASGRARPRAFAKISARSRRNGSRA